MRFSISTLALSLILTQFSAAGDDWPQWLGPQRDSVWRESGIVKKFPSKGLPVKWRVPVALGYSGPAVAAGKVYVTDYVKKSGKVTNNPGGRDVLDGSERTLCFDARDGRLVWKHEIERPYSLSYPSGPRATPAIADGKVYSLGAEGNLWCFNAADGRVVWSKDLRRAYRVRSPIWGFSGHPLVDGDTLYCLVGGKGSLMVAFDKDTGDEKWKALSSDDPGYSPPTMIHYAGVKQLLIWYPAALASLNPRTGASYWSVPLKPAYNMSIMAPRKSGEFVFASGIGNAAALIRLDGDKPGAAIEWRGTTSTAVYCVNSSPFIEEGIIYGCDVESSALMAVRLKDGERLWQTKKPVIGEGRDGRHGTTFIVRHENGFFLFAETGDLILAKLSAKGYEEISRFHVLEPTNEVFGRACVWSHPAFAEKALFARNDKELVCVDLSE